MASSAIISLMTNASQAASDVDSLQRGLEILRLFHPPQTSLSLGEISIRLGIPRATAQRLAETLVDQGFLRHGPAVDRYQPDASCFLLGHALLVSNAIGRIARPILEETAEQLGGHLVLGLRDRISMLCLGYAAARGATPINLLGPGFRVPLTATALGRAWLWSQPASVQGELIQRTKDDASDQATRTIGGLYRAFQELEEEGFCISVGDWLRDVAAVGTVVELGSGRSFGLSYKVAGPASRKELKSRIGVPLMNVAARIRDAVARQAIDDPR